MIYLGVVVLPTDGQLLEVVLARSPSRGFPRGLDGREQERDQDPDDSDDNEQFDKREGTRFAA